MATGYGTIFLLEKVSEQRNKIYMVQELLTTMNKLMWIIILTMLGETNLIYCSTGPTDPRFFETKKIILSPFKPRIKCRTGKRILIQLSGPIDLFEFEFRTFFR